MGEGVGGRELAAGKGGENVGVGRRGVGAGEGGRELAGRGAAKDPQPCVCVRERGGGERERERERKRERARDGGGRRGERGDGELTGGLKPRFRCSCVDKRILSSRIRPAHSPAYLQ